MSAEASTADESAAANAAPATTASDTEFQALLRRTRTGDEAAFSDIYRRAHPPLVRYLRVLVADDADDVASETWAQACRDWSRFQGTEDGLRGWLITIGRHRALDHLRAGRRRPADATPVEALAARPGPADTEAAAAEALGTRRAVALIAALPPDQAQAVMLRVVAGLDAKTAASILGKRPGSVRTAAHRGLRTLATRLRGGEHDDPPTA